MNRLVRAELYKLRTTSLVWTFVTANVLTTAVVLTVNCVQANSLLKSFTEFVKLSTHHHDDQPHADFLARLRDDWTLGHSAVTQAAKIYTSGQLIGVLLACLLGIVLVTSEYHHQTATSTFLLTPRRTPVLAAKLFAALIAAGIAWLASTLISVVTGVVFLHNEGYASQLSHWGVERALLLNLAAYLVWALFGIGFGALVRSQLGATVSATVLYLVGAAAAGAVFDLLSQYVFNSDSVLAWQVIVPAVASTIMISPTKTFTQSPDQWVGAAVLIGYSVLFGLLGLRALKRRDIA